MKLFLILTITFVLYITSINGQNYEAKFDSMNRKPWKELFNDACNEKWHEKWFMDGVKSSVKHTSQGMEIHAGIIPRQDSSHVVLWTKQSFKGDIKIEYDFMRLDSSNINGVNIIYIQATGSEQGPYRKDIATWNELRRIASMKYYFDHMNTYHISYAVVDGDSCDYVRGRRYIPETTHGLKGTEMTPEYFNTGLFLRNTPYHITVIKSGKELVMQVNGDGKCRTFYFNADDSSPITEGRIGLRLMASRSSLFANFTVSGINL